MDLTVDDLESVCVCDKAIFRVQKKSLESDLLVCCRISILVARLLVFFWTVCVLAFVTGFDASVDSP